jgi:DNA-binding transcriptional ArsR family regulator
MTKAQFISFTRDLFPLELVARRLKAMADRSRLSMLQSLCEHEKTVSELVEETGLGQANVSKHLRVLREEGLVLSRRRRRNMVYQLSDGLAEEICVIICRSIQERAAGETRMVRKYLEQRRARKAGSSR